MGQTETYEYCHTYLPFLASILNFWRSGSFGQIEWNTNTNPYHMNVRTILMGLGFLDGNWEEFREKTNKVNMIEPVVEGVTQLFFQSIILYIIFGPGESGGTDQGKK